MKTIIILGEEYWFEKPDTIFTEATYLLNYLEKHREKKKYNYKIIRSPLELTPAINEIKIENIKAIFLFHDIFSDSYLNRKNIYQMKEYMRYIEKQGVFIYPGIDATDNFGSKKYNKVLLDQLQFAQLPKTKVFVFPNYKPFVDEKKINTTLWKAIQELWKEFDRVVVKKGYSYEGKQVQTFNKEFVKNYGDFLHKAKKLNFKRFWGTTASAIQQDRNTDRYYIVQGYNKIVSRRDNEYRVFFHNGVPRYIAKGDMVPNTCIVDENKKTLEKAVIKFAIEVYKKYIPLFWKHQRQPILFRVDVSYAVDPQFQDKFSQEIEGFNNPVRLYANELEIDPTSFFYNEFKCAGDKTFSSKEIQRNFAKYLHKFIKSLQ